MPISSASLAVGATNSTTGGTATTFGKTGATISNGIQIADTTATSALTRKFINVKSIPAKLQNDGTWSYDKREATFVFPKVLVNNGQSYPSVRIIVSVHPEQSAAEVAEMHSFAAQAFIDSDFLGWRTMGDIS